MIHHQNKLFHKEFLPPGIGVINPQPNWLHQNYTPESESKALPFFCEFAALYCFLRNHGHLAIKNYPFYLISHEILKKLLSIKTESSETMLPLYKL